MGAKAVSIGVVILAFLYASSADGQSQCNRSNVSTFDVSPSDIPGLSPEELAGIVSIKTTVGLNEPNFVTADRIIIESGESIPLMRINPVETVQTAEEFDEAEHLPKALSALMDVVPPDIVDRRHLQTPVKRQNGRNSCVAFASLATLEVFGNVVDNLSEQYGYHRLQLSAGRECCKNRGSWTLYAPCVQRVRGVPAESTWNYTFAIPKCNHAPPTSAKTGTKYGVVKFSTLWGSLQNKVSFRRPADLERILAAGHEIVGAFWIPPAFRKLAKTTIDVRINPSTGLPEGYSTSTKKPDPNKLGGHAMLIVGYDRTKKIFIIKNSWGKKWGHDGYAIMTYDFLRTYGIQGYFVTQAGELTQ